MSNAAPRFVGAAIVDENGEHIYCDGTCYCEDRGCAVDGLAGDPVGMGWQCRGDEVCAACGTSVVADDD
jgi:hypothetical protein